MPVLDDVVVSPCVRSCTLNDDEVCIGCGRTLDEIKTWGGADPARRRRILADSAKRKTEIKRLW